jgi:hypothetical protein
MRASSSEMPDEAPQRLMRGDNTPRIHFSGRRRDHRTLCPRSQEAPVGDTPVQELDFAYCLACIRPAAVDGAQSKNVRAVRKARLVCAAHGRGLRFVGDAENELELRS